MIMNDIEKAWAAGFYDGEGSSKKKYYHYVNKKGLPRKPNQNVMMSVSQAHLETLERFKKAVGDRGTINGPYQYKGNKRPYWIWSASNKAARDVYEILKPFLSSIKKQQFEIILNELSSMSERKKGWIFDE